MPNFCDTYKGESANDVTSILDSLAGPTIAVALDAGSGRRGALVRVAA